MINTGGTALACIAAGATATALVAYIIGRRVERKIHQECKGICYFYGGFVEIFS